MSNNANKSAEAFAELIRVLEEAVREGVNSIGLEYEERELIVYYQFGNTGIGAPRVREDLQQAVIEEIAKRAGLARRPKGKMHVTLLGRDYDVIVEEYDSFGESAFNLTMKERKKKGDG